MHIITTPGGESLEIQPSTFNRTFIKSESVKIATRKANNWLKTFDLVPTVFISWNEYKISSHVIEICRLYLTAKTEVLADRDRPKSAPYLRLKNSERTSKCQSIGELGILL